jgi:enoyl-CoA hydratase/carnithine racemase
LLTSVHTAADLLSAAMALAARFRLLGPRAVAQSKTSMRLCGDSDLTAARNIGLETLAMLIDAPGWQDGMTAFMEKREPRFPPL